MAQIELDWVQNHGRLRVERNKARFGADCNFCIDLSPHDFLARRAEGF